jgi:hypothetical protein
MPVSMHEPSARDALADQDAARPHDSDAVAPTVEPIRDPVGRPKEIGGPPGPDPTRYGDWERRGRCIDF